MNNIYIYHHLGLGDHIICNGLVRNFANNNHSVSLYCKFHNIPSVSVMFQDLKNLNIVGVNNDEEIRSNPQQNTIISGIGIGGQSYDDCLWDESFYRNVNLNFDLSWSNFSYKKNINEDNLLFDHLVQSAPYAFVHDTGSDGISRIDYTKINPRLPIVRPSEKHKSNIFAYAKIILMAAEIHCINSSFIHLIDRIDTTGTLFYHKNIKLRPYSNFKLKKSWIVI